MRRMPRLWEGGQLERRQLLVERVPVVDDAIARAPRAIEALQLPYLPPGRVKGHEAILAHLQHMAMP